MDTYRNTNLKKALLIQQKETKEAALPFDILLIRKSYLTPSQLEILKGHPDLRKKIGEILIRQGMINRIEFQAALKEQSRSKEKIGAFLVHKGLITFHQLYNALSHQYNTPYMELDDFYYDELFKYKLIKFVSEKYARRNMVLPLTLEGKQLILGITYPEGFAAIEELQLIYRNLKMNAAFINEKKFQLLFTSLYNIEFQDSIETENKFENITGNVNQFNFEKLTAREKQQSNIYYGTETEIKKVVDYIINYGISNGASDIHIEQDRKGVKLRYRIDGICQEPNIPWLEEKLKDKPEAVISRIKVMSSLDIAERRLPQDGVFRASYKENNKFFDLDFRVAICPAIVGENITIRILDSRKAGLGLDNLNHSKHILAPLRQLFKSSAGMILVSGPTGNRRITLAISCKTGETELKRLVIKNGMKTMADDGLMKMNQISLSELIRVLPLEMIKEFKNRH